MTLLAAEAQASREADSGAAADLPHASLLSKGYACLAQEGGLTVTIHPPRGEHFAYFWTSKRIEGESTFKISAWNTISRLYAEDSDAQLRVMHFPLWQLVPSK